jgi:hypothetical protein
MLVAATGGGYPGFIVRQRRYVRFVVVCCQVPRIAI